MTIKWFWVQCLVRDSLKDTIRLSIFNLLQQNYSYHKLFYTNILKIVFLIHSNFKISAATGPAICIILASYAGCDRTAAMVYFVLSMALMGGFYSGMKVRNKFSYKNLSNKWRHGFLFESKKFIQVKYRQHICGMVKIITEHFRVINY